MTRQMWKWISVSCIKKSCNNAEVWLDEIVHNVALCTAGVKYNVVICSNWKECIFSALDDEVRAFECQDSKSWEAKASY